MQQHDLEQPRKSELGQIPCKQALMDRRGIAGGIVWSLVAQYFLMLLIVLAAWDTPYSLVINAISDLGAENCGIFSGREVCSPWHMAANISWAIAGACIFFGAILLWKVMARVRLAQIGLMLLMATGAGLFTVGLNPEDTSTTLHVVGALVAIFSGVPGIAVLGIALIKSSQWRGLGWVGVGLGVLGAVGIVLTMTVEARLFGLVERVAVYTWLVWIISAGIVVLRSGLMLRHAATGKR